MTEFDRVKREAKEEAAKADKVNIDVLNQKLVLLDSIASKIGHESKKEITMILSRFHANKANPIFAASLILKLLSSKEEETILDKEQKLLKQFGTGAGFMPRPQGFGQEWWQTGWQPFPLMPRQQFNSWPRYGLQPRARYNTPRQTGACYRCKKEGHQIKNCPY